MTEKQSLSHLNDHIGYWLRYVSNHVSHAFASKVEARGVTVAEWVVLRAMFDSDALTPSQLAEKVGMSRGAISKLIERLSQKALVKRTSSTDDRRYQSITLTPQGKRLVPTLARLADENDQAFFGHLKPTQRQSLIELLEDIVRRNGWKDVPVE